MPTAYSKVNELANRWHMEECTLNGEPAKIIGRSHAHATVANTSNGVKYCYGGLRCSNPTEFFWDDVDRIMRKDRAFTTNEVDPFTLETRRRGD